MLIRDALQERLQPVLEEFSRSIAHLPGLTVRTGLSFNDAFLLRAYVSAERGGSEVAITVDVKVESAALIVESEICRDDGHIYKEGPSLRVAADDERQAVALFTRWVAELREYLRDNEQYVVSLLH